MQSILKERDAEKDSEILGSAVVPTHHRQQLSCVGHLKHPTEPLLLGCTLINCQQRCNALTTITKFTFVKHVMRVTEICRGVSRTFSPWWKFAPAPQKSSCQRSVPRFLQLASQPLHSSFFPRYSEHDQHDPLGVSRSKSTFETSGCCCLLDFWGLKQWQWSPSATQLQLELFRYLFLLGLSSSSTKRHHSVAKIVQLFLCQFLAFLSAPKRVLGFGSLSGFVVGFVGFVVVVVVVVVVIIVGQVPSITVFWATCCLRTATTWTSWTWTTTWPMAKSCPKSWPSQRCDKNEHQKEHVSTSTSKWFNPETLKWTSKLTSKIHRTQRFTSRSVFRPLPSWPVGHSKYSLDGAQARPVQLWVVVFVDFCFYVGFGWLFVGCLLVVCLYVFFLFVFCDVWSPQTATLKWTPRASWRRGWAKRLDKNSAIEKDRKVKPNISAVSDIKTQLFWNMFKPAIVQLCQKIVNILLPGDLGRLRIA